MSRKEKVADEEIEFDGEEADEHDIEITKRDARIINWRRVELLNEQRMLKQQLLDMDDFSLD